MNLNGIFNRAFQAKAILFLTAVTLIPIYGLQGWQSGPHSPDVVPLVVWVAEAVAWSIRALVEIWVLFYLFSTNTSDRRSKLTLAWIEGALISLIAITVTILIVSNKWNIPTSDLPLGFFILWAAGVASFAPLMLAGVGIAYRVHEGDRVESGELLDLQAQMEELRESLKGIRTRSEVVDRREQIKKMRHAAQPMSQIAIAEALGISVQTVRKDIKAMNGKG